MCYASLLFRRNLYLSAMFREVAQNYFPFFKKNRTSAKCIYRVRASCDGHDR